MSRNIHTLQDIKRGNSSTITVTESETENVTLPKSKFYTIISNHRDELDKIMMEKLTYAGDIKAEREEKEIYKETVEKLKSENIKLKNYISSKVKKYSVEDLNNIEHNISDKTNYFLKNQDAIVQEIYNKKHADRLKALREEMNNMIITTNFN